MKNTLLKPLVKTFMTTVCIMIFIIESFALILTTANCAAELTDDMCDPAFLIFAAASIIESALAITLTIWLTDARPTCDTVFFKKQFTGWTPQYLCIKLLDVACAVIAVMVCFPIIAISACAVLTALPIAAFMQFTDGNYMQSIILVAAYLIEIGLIAAISKYRELKSNNKHMMS